jgi:hypothetical protein
MGFFGGKPGRVATHNELVVQAKHALEILKVTSSKGRDGELRPDYDPQAIPLEFRWYVGDLIEQVFFWASDPRAADQIGSRDSLREFREALARLQMYLSGAYSDAARAAFRAGFIRKVFNSASEISGELSKALAKGDRLRASLEDRIKSTIEVAGEALSWFPTQADLDKALALADEANHERGPFVLLSRLRSEVETLGHILDRMRGQKE